MMYTIYKVRSYTVYSLNLKSIGLKIRTEASVAEFKF